MRVVRWPVALALSVFGCTRDPIESEVACVEPASRCQDNVIQTCSSGQWRVALSCSEAGKTCNAKAGCVDRASDVVDIDDSLDSPDSTGAPETGGGLDSGSRARCRTDSDCGQFEYCDLSCSECISNCEAAGAPFEACQIACKDGCGGSSDGTDAADGVPSDGTDAADGLPLDGTDATDGFPTDGTDAADGVPLDGTDATDGFPTDGTDAADGVPLDGTDAADGFPTDGTDAADGVDGQDAPSDGGTTEKPGVCKQSAS